LRWLWPEIELAHPLDDGRAAFLWRDVERTSDALGIDARRWKKTFGRLTEKCDDLLTDTFAPVFRVPSHPLLLARFGIRSLPPASWTVRQWRTDEARALFGGIAAHALTSLHAPFSSAVGMMLGTVGHAYGWPVAQGGSQALAQALIRYLESLGGVVETGVHVTSLAELGAVDIVVLDTSPVAAAAIIGETLPSRVNKAYAKYKWGPGAYKVDFAIRGDIPWTNSAVSRAGTIHCGGSFEDIAIAEKAVARGQMPTQPFVLVGQQYVADPTRSTGDVNPIWAYAHVPHAFTGDATDAIISQIERFAPGFRERIVKTFVRSTMEMESYNPNYVGGDIAVGANSMKQMIMRPRFAVNPYATGVKGVYLCSSATPPGGGVHGMCGYNAARAALKDL
jgi:phytoene dehydrogenase-like protein